MANTVVSSAGFTAISAMDSDYDVGEVIPVHSIKFYPADISDLLVVFEGGPSGPEACRLLSSDGEPRIEYFDGNSWTPYIDFSACTLGVGHKVIIVRDRHRK